MIKTRFHDFTTDQLTEHLAHYLVPSLSYSGLRTFRINELNFLRTKVFREGGRRGSSGVVGNAYHKGLDLYFDNKKHGIITPIEESVMASMKEISAVEAQDWQCQKKTPTVEDCINVSVKKSSQALNNFYAEVKAYDFVKEVLFTEGRFENFININGVDIPLPFISYLDMGALDHKDLVVLVDHKSVTSHTDLKEAEMKYSDQAMLYTKVWESLDPEGRKVDRFIFAENKISKNTKQNLGKPQIQMIELKMTPDNRTLWELKLYEVVRRCIEAISNPDHVYLPNYDDYFCDKAELMDFWIRTQIGEISEFPNLGEREAKIMEKRKNKIRNSKLIGISPEAVKAYREHTKSFVSYSSNITSMKPSEQITTRLALYGIPSQVVSVQKGFSSTTYLLEIQAGVKIDKIKGYKMDIASALGVREVRILKNLVIFEGKSLLAVEAPTAIKEDEDIDPILWDHSLVSGCKIPIGVKNDGSIQYWDMANPSMPHAVVAGGTGSGKSVCIKTALESFKVAYPEGKIIILDPKHEFKDQASEGILVVNNPEEINTTVIAEVKEMKRRVEAGERIETLILFDEISDAFAFSEQAEKEWVKRNTKVHQGPRGGVHVEKPDERRSLKENIKLIAQLGRSSGYHLILATQYPTAELLDNQTKANLPVQICFKVQSAVNSQVVIDEEGAETLRGKGDGLFRSPLTPNPVRFQGYFIQ